MATDLKSFPFSPALSYFQLYIDSSDSPPPLPFLKGRGDGGAESEKILKGGRSVVQGQVFLKGRGLAIFLSRFIIFKFKNLKITLPFAK